MRKFKEGDTVKLASGGPLMTVKKYISDTLVECCWFVKENLLHGEFEEVLLRKGGKGPNVRVVNRIP